MTTNALNGPLRDASMVTLSLLAWQFGGLSAEANPAGGTVAQGSATFHTTGSQLTINTSANSVINWQSFNIGVGETTTFVEPSSTSVVWNHINDANPSQIFGNLNANGIVVLQNQNGFYVGGAASIKTAGLVMTTSPVAPSVSSGGAWQFDALPPMVPIINYGQISVSGGGSLFLIANDIENRNGVDNQGYSGVGTLSAPGGKIGLYAGQQVLVSTSPDGRGLNAKVTLPQGSVDNEGRLIADGGSIAAMAQTVNNNGVIQANTVQDVNGVIELVASGNLTLGASSDIEANGDSSSASASPGGMVVLQAGNNYSDTATSTINVSGQSGGQNGLLEVFGGNLTDATSLSSQIGNNYALLVNPYDITLSSYTDTSSSSPTLKTSDLANYSQIDLHALDNIELSTPWTLNASASPARLCLQAGNSVILDDSTGINAGNNWSVNLLAGAAYTGATAPASGSDGIYLNGAAYLQTQNGSLSLSAANEVQVGWSGSSLGSGVVNPGAGSISTVGGGSISVTTEYGDINTGSDINGYTFGLGKNSPPATPSPYYKVSADLGGISTSAGGNVSLVAGADVISFLPRQSDYTDALHDAGTGAFGPEAGNVTITAGGNVYGHFVLANGIGDITAGADIGAPLSTLSSQPGDGFALSLIAGSWNVQAPNGSIYVQDVRNPNGVFGEKNSGSSPGTYAGYHYFDYSPAASVSLDAANTVEITGFDAPHTPPSSSFGVPIPLIFPPSLTVVAGAGGFILDALLVPFGEPDLILFPSPDQSLSITTRDGGNFGIPNSESPYTADVVTLEMSDSAATRWTSSTSFDVSDQAPTLTAVNNASPVSISISGSMNALDLYTTKSTDITVAGDMINCGFQGENRSSSDVTSIHVAGNIYNSPLDAFEQLASGIVSANPNQPTVWDSVFDFAINPALAAAISNINVNNIPPTDTLATYLKANNYLLFPSSVLANYGANPGFIYDPVAKILGFQGVMPVLLSPAQIAALENGTFTVLVADAKGTPVVDANGHLETMTYTFNGAPSIAALSTASLNSIYGLTPNVVSQGYQIGGPGQFNIAAASINLGNSAGIGSLGFSGYAALAPLLPTAASGGASVSVTVAGNLNMITSSIFSEDGGNVTVNVGGNIDLTEGSPGHYFDFQSTKPYGIYTSGHSDVSVYANGDIDVGNARIATFDGGNVFVESFNGDVNLGGGITEALSVQGVCLDPATGLPVSEGFGNLDNAATLIQNPAPYGSGILAEMPDKFYQTGNVSQPGSITVETPKGNILSTSGGISQLALDGSLQGPSVTLSAGIPGVTPPTDPNAGNILLGAGGIIGGNVSVFATGGIQGYFISKQNLNVTGQTFSGLGLAGQAANVTASEPGGGPAIVVGIGSVNANGLGSDAKLLGQNVSADGGAAQSTLGTSVNASAASQSAAGVSSTETKQQVASNENNSEDDDKKKQAHQLMRHVKRVTVLLPKT